MYYTIVTKPLTANLLPKVDCPVCRKPGGLEVTLYMQYIAALIPIFGMGRRTGVACTLCGCEIKDPQAGLFSRDEYSPEITQALKDIKAGYKRTAWQLLYPWSLCILLCAIFAVAAIYGTAVKIAAQRVAANDKELLAHPQVGDLYKMTVFSQDSGRQTMSQRLVKIVRIAGNTMYVVVGKQAALAAGINDSDWKDLPRGSDAFDATEYKVDMKKFISDVEPQFYLSDDNSPAGGGQTPQERARAALAASKRSFAVLEKNNNGQLHVVERP